MIKQVITKTVVTEIIQVFGDQLHRALVDAKIIEYREGWITHVDIRFKVPGGADWSNTELDIDHDNPLWVIVTRTKEV